jgi:hypothetical protein
MIELKPLPGFNDTWPADINDLGRVAGTSFGPIESGGPYSVATLWSPGPMHSGGLPSIYALSTSGKISSSVKINNKGEIVYYEYDGGNYSWFLWTNEASVDLETLGVGSVADLNDEGLILGGPPGASNSLVVYDRGADILHALPPITVGGEAQLTYACALDNAGRVLAAFRTPGDDPATPLAPDFYIYHHYYLEIGDTSWKPTHISSPWLATLSKHGWVLGSVLDSQSNNIACYLDLNDPTAGLSLIPRLVSGTGRYTAVAKDANAQGRIVGHEDWDTPI